MKSKPIKITVTATVLLAALFGLMYTTLSEGTEYYKHVNEVMTEPAAWYGKRLQLHGRVVEKSIEKKRGSLDYRFKVENDGHIVQATYTGVVPDGFEPEAEVIVEGTLSPDAGSFAAVSLKTKCASKYNPLG